MYECLYVLCVCVRVCIIMYVCIFKKIRLGNKQCLSMAQNYNIIYIHHEI